MTFAHRIYGRLRFHTGFRNGTGQSGRDQASIRDSGLNALIEVQAIFDMPGTSDPRCTAALNTL